MTLSQVGKKEFVLAHLQQGLVHFIGFLALFICSVQIKGKKLGIHRMPSSWNLDFRQRFWLSVKKLSFFMISVVIDGMFELFYICMHSLGIPPFFFG